MSVLNYVSIYQVGAEIFHWMSEKFDLPVDVRQKVRAPTQVSLSTVPLLKRGNFKHSLSM